LADQRPSFSGYYEHPFYRLLFRWIDFRKVHVIRRVLSELPHGAVVVDIGCGLGRILSRVVRPGDTALAADRDFHLAAAARARGLTPVGADFDSPLPFGDGTVDAAMMIDAIEHSENPRRIIDELHRVLRPGGVAIVFTPPHDSVRWILAVRFHHLVTRRPADHIAPFTEESLEWAIGRRFEDFRLGRVNSNLSLYAVARKQARSPGVIV
jgi:SAM-dependent methyltransferase